MTLASALEAAASIGLEAVGGSSIEGQVGELLFAAATTWSWDHARQDERLVTGGLIVAAHARARLLAR